MAKSKRDQESAELEKQILETYQPKTVEYETRKYAVYTILGYTIEGNKEILDYGSMRQKANISGCRF